MQKEIIILSGISAMNLKNFFYSYWKTILVICGIFYLSFAPASTFKSVPRFPNADKITHFLMYFGLVIVLIYDFKKRNNSEYTYGKFIAVCILFPILLGGIIEILQEAFFKPRSAEWLDWLSDIAGVLIGWLVMLPFLKKKDTNNDR